MTPCLAAGYNLMYYTRKTILQVEINNKYTSQETTDPLYRKVTILYKGCKNVSQFYLESYHVNTDVTRPSYAH